MPGFKSTTKEVPRSSQATPLANDLLEMFRQSIQNGTFGEGLGPLQRESGTAIRQFVNSGGGQFDTTEMFKNMEAGHLRRVDQGSADLKESFAAVGGRLGTGLARADADFRANTEAQYGAEVGKINASMFNEQMNRLLEGINLMFNQGQSNIAPALQYGSQGIVPSTVIAEDGVVKQGLDVFKGLFDIFSKGKEIYDGRKQPTGGPGGTVPTPTGGNGWDWGDNKIPDNYQPKWR